MTDKKDFFKFSLLGFAISVLCVLLMSALIRAANEFAYRHYDLADQISLFAHWIFLIVFWTPGIWGVYFLIEGVLSKRLSKFVGFILGAAVVYVALICYVAYAISKIDLTALIFL